MAAPQASPNSTCHLWRFRASRNVMPRSPRSCAFQETDLPINVVNTNEVWNNIIEGASRVLNTCSTNTLAMSLKPPPYARRSFELTSASVMPNTFGMSRIVSVMLSRATISVARDSGQLGNRETVPGSKYWYPCSASMHAITELSINTTSQIGDEAYERTPVIRWI